MLDVDARDLIEFERDTGGRVLVDAVRLADATGASFFVRPGPRRFGGDDGDGASPPSMAFLSFLTIAGPTPSNFIASSGELRTAGWWLKLLIALP